MAIICKPSEEGLKLSKFQVNNKKAKFINYPLALAKLAEQGHEISESEALLASAFKEAKRKASNPREDDGQEEVITTPNKQSLWIFQDFRFAVRDGTTVWFIRKSPDTQEYIETIDPLTTAMEVQTQIVTRDGSVHRRTLYNKILARYKQVIRAKLLFQGRFEKKESEDGTVTYQAQSLTSYWDTVMKEHFCKCEEYMIPMPSTISIDPNEPTFFFFDESKLEPTGHSEWLKWEQRIPEEFRGIWRAWIWSIFDPGNNGRQAMWLLDGGFSGKSTVLKVIGEFMGGRAHAAVSKNGFNNQFSNAKFYGKRLITYGDNTNPLLHKTEVFHSLLGGDIVDVERKHKNSFSAELCAKLLIASNCAPRVDLNKRNETTRLICIPLIEPPEEYLKEFCEVDEHGELVRDEWGELSYIGGNLKEKLAGQFGSYLLYCKKSYKQLCKNRSDIYVNSRAKRIIRDECGSETHYIQEDFVYETLSVHTKNSGIPKEEMEILSRDLKEKYLTYVKDRGERENEFTWSEFRRYLKDTYGITSVQDKVKEDGIWRTRTVFRGICEKHEYLVLQDKYKKIEEEARKEAARKKMQEIDKQEKEEAIKKWQPYQEERRPRQRQALRKTRIPADEEE